MTTLSLAVLSFGSSAFAQTAGDDDNMIQIGGGAMNGPKAIEALFRVNGSSKIPLDGDNDAPYFIVARINMDMTAGSGGVPFIDLQFDGIGYETGNDDMFSKNFVSFSLLNLDLQKDLAINNELSYRISFIGIKAGAEGYLSEDAKIAIKGALDLLGFALSERASDGSRTDGAGGYGLSGEIGFKFFEKYHVAFGEKFGATFSDGIQYVDGIECHTSYNHYGNGYSGYGYSSTYCKDRIVTDYRQHRYTSRTYLNLAADLTKNLQAFGQVSYNVYKVRDRTGKVAASTNSALAFKLGVAYKF
ncbi:MAG: hypothetical protein HYW49_08835 [Deltaproteobacteria bacterium]|nr:hypothetical protein [Deltaproteobacteria bacterium]